MVNMKLKKKNPEVAPGQLYIPEPKLGEPKGCLSDSWPCFATLTRTQDKAGALMLVE